MYKKLFCFGLAFLLSIPLSACKDIQPMFAETMQTETSSATLPQSTELLAARKTDSGLTLALLGKETEYCVGIREIQVYEGETLLQSVLISEAIEKDGTDGIDIGYSQAPDTENAVHLQDVNFDGYPDLQVCGWMPNNAFPYYFWCYDPVARRFDYAFTLQLQRVDTENRQLVAWYKAENGLYQTDYYQVDPQNQLQLIHQETEDVRPNQTSEPIANIPFRSIYRGFTAVPWEEIGVFDEFGVKIISNETAWSTFMATYCPGIPYYDTWDFSRESLLVSIKMGARPSYVHASPLTKLSWQGSYFVFDYDSDPASYIHALNTDASTHFYVEVLVIRNADLPADAAALAYQP